MSNAQVVNAALNWLDTPYRHQASQLKAGCDCLGLIRGVWRTLYGDEPTTIPPYARRTRDPEQGTQLLDAARVFLLESARETVPGRVILFQLSAKRPPRHCGILIDDDHFIHAQERRGVVIAELDRNWRRRIHSFFAFPERI